MCKGGETTQKDSFNEFVSDISDIRRGSIPSFETAGCSECGSSVLVTDDETGEVSCIHCGLVMMTESINQNPEWNSYNVQEHKKRSRIGSPTKLSIPDKGLSTTIDKQNRDARGKPLPASQRTQFFRLRSWQRKAHTSDRIDRNLSIALQNISTICSSLNLPPITVETACYIYRRVLRAGLSRRRPLQALAAASVYLACRKNGVARSLSEVVHVTHRDRKEISKCYRLILKKLQEVALPTAPSHYVSRIINDLSLSGRVEQCALQIIRTTQTKKLAQGKRPLSVATAAIYIASMIMNERRSQRAIALITDVTEVTLRNRAKDLVRMLEITIRV